MNTLIKIVVMVLIAAGISLGMAGCKGDHDHPSGEEPSKQVSTEEEHPSNEHPTEEAPPDEHPNDEHPQ